MMCLIQVVNAWLKCFHVIVPLLDKALIKAKILPVALAKGANDETSVQSRVICCAMLGSMAACLTKVTAMPTRLPKCIVQDMQHHFSCACAHEVQSGLQNAA